MSGATLRAQSPWWIHLEPTYADAARAWRQVEKDLLAAGFRTSLTFRARRDDDLFEIRTTEAMRYLEGVRPTRLTVGSRINAERAPKALFFARQTGAMLGISVETVDSLDGLVASW